MTYRFEMIDGVSVTGVELDKHGLPDADVEGIAEVRLPPGIRLVPLVRPAQAPRSSRTHADLS
jgi:hypothetical protein